MTETLQDTTSTVFIDGQWIPDARAKQAVLDPATEEIIGYATECSVEQALNAAAAARRAQLDWESTPVSERARLLRSLAAAVRESLGELAAITAAETGMPLDGATGRVFLAAKTLDDVAERCLGTFAEPLEPQEAFGPRGPQGVAATIGRKAVGVVACITPYNGPIIEVAGKAGSALAMGNTVVIKPAPQNPLAVTAFVKLCEQVGFPPGVINLVTSSKAEVSSELCASPDVDMISFTGSTAVGEAIYRSAASGMKRLLLELGGKGACIVMDDADLDLAATVISSVWTELSGQICAAPTRVVAHESIHDALVERLVELADGIIQGPPTASGVTMGPVISAAQRDRIEGFVERAVADGAVLSAGGRRPQLERGFYVQPTLLTECTQNMEIVRNEVFGPVVTVQRAGSTEDAVSQANDSDFGLVNYVFGSPDRARETGAQLRAGVVMTNFGGFVEGIPIGGFKKSGIGRAHGEAGLLTYTEISTLVEGQS